MDGQRLVAVTITKRPQCIADCYAHLERQTRPPDAWVLACHGFTPPGDPGGPFPVCALGVDGDATISTLRNIAYSRAFDLGADAAACIDDDDYYPPHYLERVAAAIERAPEAGLWGVRRWRMGWCDEPAIGIDLAGIVYSVEQTSERAADASVVIARRSWDAGIRFWRGVPKDMGAFQDGVAAAGLTAGEVDCPDVMFVRYTVPDHAHVWTL